MRKVALLAGGLVLLLCFAASARGTTYYVAQQDAKASDDNPGTEAAPWKTITRCLKELKAGDTVIVKKGVYREELILPRKDWDWKGIVRPAFRSRTDYAHMITFLAEPGDDVVIQGSDVVTGWKLYKDRIYVREDWPVNTQQVFCDGVLLKQIAGTMPKMLRDVWKGRSRNRWPPLTQVSPKERRRDRGSPAKVQKRMDIIALAFELAGMVEAFVGHARVFYYEVMLSGYACPRCGGRLVMVGENRASMRT